MAGAKIPIRNPSGLFLPPPHRGTRVSHPALRSGQNLRFHHLRAAALRQVSDFPRVRSTGRVRPDFIFPLLRVAVFVDGCFWHGCPRHGTKPKTRAAFWLAKITGNKARDRRVNSALRKRGWTVLRIWEHELRRKDEARLLKRLKPHVT